MAPFVRMILQREENKGVELTVWRENRLGGQSIDLENVRQGHQFDDDGSSHFVTIVAVPAQFHFSGNRVNQALSGLGERTRQQVRVRSSRNHFSACRMSWEPSQTHVTFARQGLCVNSLEMSRAPAAPACVGTPLQAKTIPYM